ncbi:MAG: 1-deoxy-D-xylulose-5-phosphate reductoisomerase [Planctomycetaceae bacterium]|nr:1-deoxy-D-xylulose-5-phosphate reductoisomerase [Planctomycetaceae bacterium]
MTFASRNLAILGASGSIGRSTLDVVAASEGRFQIFGLTAHRQLEEIVQQTRCFVPQIIVGTDPDAAAAFDTSTLHKQTKLLKGAEGIQELVTDPQVDIVVAAIVGSAGLTGTWQAVDAGKTVALANKESLVMGGPLLMDLAADKGATILPIDSEHSAVFQALQAGRQSEVQRIILTASGGPFRNFSQDDLEKATVAQALNHPTWKMGPKITVDSATMMNKALEIIEARWLFDLPTDKIEVVIHPQSIVHSLVEFIDGSIVAQLSPPDMRLPIQYALSYPNRTQGSADRLDLRQSLQLDFHPPDLDRFPALSLGLEVAQAGGTAGAVLNAANESAVNYFLDGKLRFTEIVSACRDVLEKHTFDANPSLEALLKIDAWAREEITKWVST